MSHWELLVHWLQRQTGLGWNPSSATYYLLDNLGNAEFCRDEAISSSGKCGWYTPIPSSQPCHKYWAQHSAYWKCSINGHHYADEFYDYNDSHLGFNSSWVGRKQYVRWHGHVPQSMDMSRVCGGRASGLELSAYMAWAGIGLQDVDTYSHPLMGQKHSCKCWWDFLGLQPNDSANGPFWDLRLTGRYW